MDRVKSWFTRRLFAWSVLFGAYYYLGYTRPSGLAELVGVTVVSLVFGVVLASYWKAVYLVVHEMYREIIETTVDDLE